MNPLCCIAPVSIEKDRTNSPSSVVVRSQSECQLGFESSVRSVRPASFSAQVSSVGTESDNVIHEVEDSEIEVREKDSSVSKSMVFCGNGGGAVAGILYKWVNYGKGWRSRWFTLEDGVLSYYKTHGPDKILLSPGREKVIKVIGEESIRYMRKCSNGSNHNRFCAKQWKPYGEIHLKVSSVRASKSDDKRLSIFSGTKTLHLRCISREDRGAWIESLVAAKDKFPRLLSPGDLAPSEDMVISTEKLRSRLSQEGIAEEVIKDCESIMLGELSALQNQMKALQLKHIVLLDTLRQLETEKIELETTVVDETKERDSSCGQDRRFSDFYSIMSEGSGSDSDADNESQYGVNVESDEENGTFFDTNEFMSSDVLRCASYRSRDNNNNHCISNERDRDTFPSNRLLLREAGTEISLIQYPHIKRRESLPEPKEKEKPVGLWSIIKDNIGKDLSGVCLPVYFNEPLSSLQKCFEDLEYSCLVDRALEWGKQGNDLMRILSIAAFAVSGYASTEGRQCKPFNPLLGETYEADYPDKGLRFFSEKVSHHPMIVACHCEGRGWKFWADSNLKGKFWGSLEISVNGKPCTNAFILINGSPILESLFLEVAWRDDEEEYNFNIPTLKRLELRTRKCLSVINKVVLNVPNLEYFLVGGVLCSLFVMKDLSNLVEATFSFYEIRFSHLMSELLKGISEAKSLSWSTSNIDLPIPLNSPLPKFLNLKRLELKGSCSRWLSMFHVLENSCELEHLCIDEPEEFCWIEPQQIPTCMLSNLTTLNFKRCNGRKWDLQFLEYMLGNSEVLKTLTIITSETLSPKKEMWLCAQLLKFPRASRSCEIHFVGNSAYN